MFFLLWDASALAQRYAPETGQPTVNALFFPRPNLSMFLSALIALSAVKSSS